MRFSFHKLLYQQICNRVSSVKSVKCPLCNMLLKIFPLQVIDIVNDSTESIPPENINLLVF